MNRQTVIPLGMDDAGLERFFSGQNKLLIEEIKLLINRQRAKRTLYLWGEPGSGKSHLLDTCCVTARKSGIPNLYLSLNQRDGPDESMKLLNQANPRSLVCIDDLQATVDREDAQTQLLALYEKIIGGGGAIVVSGTSPLANIGLQLKDLVSRLSSGGVFNLQPLNDDEKREALKLTAHQRGINLEDNVIEFIMSHYSRDSKSLFALLDKLDSESLQSQRKITIPFVKSLIQ